VHETGAEKRAHHEQSTEFAKLRAQVEAQKHFETSEPTSSVKSREKAREKIQSLEAELKTAKAAQREAADARKHAELMEAEAERLAKALCACRVVLCCVVLCCVVL
jgi:hypothetical protein